MSLYQGIKMAVGSIMGNKLRSFLTMLGMIIGVGAVITLVGVGEGSSKDIQESVQGLGTNLITVRINGWGTDTTLSYEETLEYAEEEEIAAVSPLISGSVTAKNGAENDSFTAEGVTPEYEEVRDFSVQSGRFIMDVDIKYRQNVAVIGTETAETLFGTEDPIDQYIRINGVQFKVVGLLEEKGSSLGGSNDDKILIPISTAERLLKQKGVSEIYVEAESAELVDQAVTTLEQILYKRFNSEEDDNAFSVFNSQDALEAITSVNDTMTQTLAGIAAISLVVGGIGIMNIMLVSVSERTREIGIRKAIGAKRGDILFQFLVESIVLGGIGGLLGVAAGIGVSLFLQYFMDMTVVLQLKIMLISFSFSLGVGVIFGLLPANKASRLKPIEALRSN